MLIIVNHHHHHHHHCPFFIKSLYNFSMVLFAIACFTYVEMMMNLVLSSKPSESEILFHLSTARALGPFSFYQNNPRSLGSEANPQVSSFTCLFQRAKLTFAPRTRTARWAERATAMGPIRDRGHCLAFYFSWLALSSSSGLLIQVSVLTSAAIPVGMRKKEKRFNSLVGLLLKFN